MGTSSEQGDACATLDCAATGIGKATDTEQPASDLLPQVYEELRKLAVARMADETGTQTLQPTALVHEVWLRLGGSASLPWKNRAHFFGAAAEAMRRIL